jgi:PKD repeat protein
VISGYPSPHLTWDFGDSTPPSTEPNPVHAYLTEGVFDVTLLAENLFGQASATGVITTYVPAAANFTPLEATAAVGQLIAFTNLSTGTGPLTFSWEFGDGSPVSSEVNPVHAYSALGDYTVVLTVEGPYGTAQIEGVIHVTKLYMYMPIIKRDQVP